MKWVMETKKCEEVKDWEKAEFVFPMGDREERVIFVAEQVKVIVRIGKTDPVGAIMMLRAFGCVQQSIIHLKQIVEKLVEVYR